MKTIHLTLIIVTIAIIQLFFEKTYAQVPNIMSYQAVIRDNNGELVINRMVGIRIQIKQGSEYGASAFVEVHKRQTNENGLVTLEIGGGTALVGSMTEIKWEEGPYFIQTEIDLSGGTNYSITTSSQLLSVPYAFYALKAGLVNEKDPVYISSVASGITTDDTARWNAKLGSFTEVDPFFNTSVAKGITSADTARWNHKITSEKQNLNDVLAKGNNGGGMQIKNIANPTEAQDAATKAYVDVLNQQIENLALKVNTIEARGPLTDIEGNVYNTVKIGNQVWMAENLKTTRFTDSTSIPYGIDINWQNLKTPVYCWKDFNVNKSNLGAYYNFYTVATEKLCPVGWKVPSINDWRQLVAYLGDSLNAGGNLKAVGTEYWEDPNNGANNSAGFNGLGLGYYVFLSKIDGFDFFKDRYKGLWWSYPIYSDGARAFELFFYDTSASISGMSKNNGINVRCIKE